MTGPDTTRETAHGELERTEQPSLATPSIARAAHSKHRRVLARLRWAWRTLTAMRTAVVLLALVAAAAIPGSLLPQRNVASDPAAVTNFYSDNPDLAPWLDRIQLFDVYASSWFASIYLLLLVSMIGCVLPRSVRLWRSVRSAPPAAPRFLARMERHAAWSTEWPADAVVGQAEEAMRDLGYRVEVVGTEVRGERGYLREVGNLLFHMSLLVLLVGVGAGRLFGFEGRVALIEGGSFSNLRSQYDAFTPSVWTDVEGLEPFSFKLDDFDATFEQGAVNSGQPRSFLAELSVTSGDGAESRSVRVRPNEPLDVNETKAFLTGHGYAPEVTVRDGEGNVAFSGPVMFLPLDQNYTSEGVVKVPDAVPDQLGFEGLFLPTGVIDERGPMSAFPDDLNPMLVLTAFTGDLGLDAGTPQSVFSIDKSAMVQVEEGDQPFSRALSVGETMELPGGQGSLRFDGVARFANFQIAYDPGKEISLAAGVLLLAGLTMSLVIRRRQLWLRVNPGGEVEVASRSLTRRPLPEGDVDRLLARLDVALASGVDRQPRLPDRRRVRTSTTSEEDSV